MSTIHTVNSDQATFLGMAFEALAYGIYSLLFFTSLAVLTWRTPALNASKKPMFATTIFMFSLATVHFSLNFHNVYQGLMVKPRAHISDETHLLAGADMLFSITDFCNLSLLSCLGTEPMGNHTANIHLIGITCGITLIGLVLTINPTAPQAPEAIVPIGTAAFAILNQETKTDSAIRRASAIVIESGLLFLAAQLVFVVLFAIKHPAQAIVEPIATQIYGISPTLIIVRVGMGSTFEATTLPESSLRFRVSFAKKSKLTESSMSRITGTTIDVEMANSSSPSEHTIALSSKVVDV
ncbi:hypothetical protein J3R30DRAFT_3776041 [Lentinula aciculospora]|uniref:Uncharacterized protein n=1 Tax=Lentinula aciculospora TaxID=153920 RepID=A0A9W9A6U5_9AGAR|nr:hypothetical protein J3R30DRAFT_3776041 [Lentinula aciculospora]